MRLLPRLLLIRNTWILNKLVLLHDYACGRSTMSAPGRIGTARFWGLMNFSRPWLTREEAPEQLPTASFAFLQSGTSARWTDMSTAVKPTAATSLAKAIQ